ncbi:hypothetical protein GWI72_03135 [Microvirga tunisiensis]|uniref:DUF2946 domain-containing protein n=1 Tax=Pannonibacter tanglangensis TaxID=2750084 RepID=A0A7X5F2F0_9HYPH|nr:hypothetical protein [Pannonibacter sp. XCT-53]NBN77259.1 hypothetical protein [Pannonibacter sp. XCT-53]
MTGSTFLPALVWCGRLLAVAALMMVALRPAASLAAQPVVTAGPQLVAGLLLASLPLTAVTGPRRADGQQTGTGAPKRCLYLQCADLVRVQTSDLEQAGRPDIVPLGRSPHRAARDPLLETEVPPPRRTSTGQPVV